MSEDEVSHWERIPGAIRFYPREGKMTLDYFTCRYRRVVKERLEGAISRIREEEKEGRAVYVRDVETNEGIYLAAKILPRS